MYPKNRTEMERAKANVVKVVHSEQVQQMVVQAMQHQSRAKALAAVMAQILKTLILSITKNGRKPRFQLVAVLGKAILDEFRLIAKQMGVALPDNELQQIGKLAGDIVQQSLNQTPHPNGNNTTQTAVPAEVGRGALQSVAGIQQ